MIVQQPDRSGSSYSVIYGNQTNFGIEFGSFSPEVYTGSGFPGSEETRTVIYLSEPEMAGRGVLGSGAPR